VAGDRLDNCCLQKRAGENKVKVDWLIVGAGFSGSVIAERIASQLGERVLIVESRDHIGGNAYDYFNENGILVHKYGPHLFHTNSKKVWDYLSGFTDWTPYFHKVLAFVEGKTVPVPFNLNSINALFPKGQSARLEELLLKNFSYGDKIPVFKMIKHTNQEISTLGNYIYSNILLGYTVKQWDLKPEELDSSVTGRVPFSFSRDDRYFKDKYQALPKHGYTNMFKRILKHKGIKVLLNTNYKEVFNEIEFKQMVYTGPIDSFFDYKHGALPYRSLTFDFQFHENDFQEAGQINFPNEFEFTRITEYKKLTGQHIKGTTISLEYPEPYEAGVNEPYYPVPKKENTKIYALYQQEAQRLEGKVIFAGRLAEYKYYNMDQVVARALHVFETEIKPKFKSLL
jgi:UDP-galactopyranose mutase